MTPFCKTFLWLNSINFQTTIFRCSKNYGNPTSVTSWITIIQLVWLGQKLYQTWQTQPVWNTQSVVLRTEFKFFIWRRMNCELKKHTSEGRTCGFAFFVLQWTIWNASDEFIKRRPKRTQDGNLKYFYEKKRQNGECSVRNFRRWVFDSTGVLIYWCKQIEIPCDHHPHGVTQWSISKF